mmetsp:Transcript_67441/g.209103  ORF Transcript_67441/g.209103 Transcript_67441/m.209103 type:complete len:358 (-) Transcript_67441:12-1085(-)
MVSQAAAGHARATHGLYGQDLDLKLHEPPNHEGYILLIVGRLVHKEGVNHLVRDIHGITQALRRTIKHREDWVASLEWGEVLTVHRWVDHACELLVGASGEGHRADQLHALQRHGPALHVAVAIGCPLAGRVVGGHVPQGGLNKLLALAVEPRVQATRGHGAHLEGHARAAHRGQQHHVAVGPEGHAHGVVLSPEVGCQLLGELVAGVHEERHAGGCRGVVQVQDVVAFRRRGCLGAQEAVDLLGPAALVRFHLLRIVQVLASKTTVEVLLNVPLVGLCSFDIGLEDHELEVKPMAAASRPLELGEVARKVHAVRLVAMSAADDADAANAVALGQVPAPWFRHGAVGAPAARPADAA